MKEFPQRDRIREFIVSDLVKNEDYSVIEDEQDLITSGIIDSLGIMKLVAYLEENFAIKVEDTEIVPENFISVDTISAYVAAKNASGIEML